MFICKDCGHQFEEPGTYEERHGFDYGLFEKFSCCPACKSTDYCEGVICNECGELIPEDEAVIDESDDTLLCHKCCDAAALDAAEKEEICSQLNTGIEELLGKIYETYDIKTGYIMPIQQYQYEELTDKLGTLFAMLVKQNRGRHE